MSGTAYKALGFVVWKGGTWYLRRRYGVGKRATAGALAGIGVAAVVAAIALAHRRNGDDS